MTRSDGESTTEPSRESTQSAVTVHAHVRPALVMDPVDSKLETLRALEADGTIGELSIHAWPGTVPLSAESTYGDVLDAVDSFRAWAEGRDAELGPAFETHTVSSEFVERTREVLRTPVMCLAVYAGGRLVAVYPHADGDTHHTVSEAIAAIRTGEFAGLARPSVDDRATPATCSRCGQRFANVQGLLACPGCPVTPFDETPGKPTEDPAGARRRGTDEGADPGPSHEDYPRSVE